MLRIRIVVDICWWHMLVTLCWWRMLQTIYVSDKFECWWPICKVVNINVSGVNILPFVFETLQMFPKCLSLGLQFINVQVINIEWLTTFSKNLLLTVTFGTTTLLAFLKCELSSHSWMMMDQMVDLIGCWTRNRTCFWSLLDIESSKGGLLPFGFFGTFGFFLSHFLFFFNTSEFKAGFFGLK